MKKYTILLLMLLVFSVTYSYTEILFEDDFETGDTSNWNSATIDAGNSIVIVSTLSHTGKYCAEFNDIVGNNEAYLSKTGLTEAPTIYVRFYMMISTRGWNAASGSWGGGSRNYRDGIEIVAEGGSQRQLYTSQNLTGNNNDKRDFELGLSSASGTGKGDWEMDYSNRRSNGEEIWNCFEVMAGTCTMQNRPRWWINDVEQYNEVSEGLWDFDTYEWWSSLNCGICYCAGTGFSQTIYIDDVVVATDRIGMIKQEQPYAQ